MKDIQMMTDIQITSLSPTPSICLNDFDAPMRTPCHHWFCFECIMGAIENNPKCPLCR